MSKHFCYFCEREIPQIEHSHTTASLPILDLQKLSSTWNKAVPKRKKNKWVCCSHFLPHLQFKFGAKNYPGLRAESPQGKKKVFLFLFYIFLLSCLFTFCCLLFFFASFSFFFSFSVFFFFSFSFFFSFFFSFSFSFSFSLSFSFSFSFSFSLFSFHFFLLFMFFFLTEVFFSFQKRVPNWIGKSKGGSNFFFLYSWKVFLFSYYLTERQTVFIVQIMPQFMNLKVVFCFFLENFLFFRLY